MAIPVEIGNLSFRTKREAKKFFKDMLARYKNKQDINKEDSEHLRYLIERHPEAARKIGCGIVRFYKDRTSKNTSCFWLERKDGASTEFSYLTCVDARGKSLHQEFAEACREAVASDLEKAKRDYFRESGDREGKVICDVTGEKVAFSEAHLDHKGPMTFQVIVKTFVTANEIKISRDMLSTPQDAQFATKFVDDGIRAKFRDYHLRVAELRIVKANVNLSLGGSERIIESKNPVQLPK